MSKLFGFSFSARNYGADIGFGGSELGRNVTLRDSASGIAGAYLGDLFVGQLAMGVSLAVRVARFLAHIVVVILARAQEKVLRVYAFTIVAFVENPEIARRFAVSQNPRKPMSAYQFVAAGFDRTIPALIYRALPFPTIIRAALIHLLPKAVGKGNCAVGAVIVTADVANGFASNPTAILIRRWGKFGFLAAAAMTKTVRDCGIIVGHQNLAFWCLIRGRCLDAARYFCCVLPLHFSTNELEAQRGLV